MTEALSDNYIIRFDINANHYYAIWYTDDSDGFITENESIVYFKNLNDLMQYTHDHKILLNDGITYFNTAQIFDNIDSAINCDDVLNFWNIISDIASSLRIDFIGDNKIYNTEYAKLVSGCNLNALEHDYYEPDWTEKEVDNIKKIISEGLMILCEIFRHQT